MKGRSWRFKDHGCPEHGSLGFSPVDQGATIHTPYGILVRESGGRKKNLPGSQLDLWRVTAAHNAGRVILTEGASDAIAAIDAGLEHVGTTAVLALPTAATSFQEPGIEALAGIVNHFPVAADTRTRTTHRGEFDLCKVLREIRGYANSYAGFFESPPTEINHQTTP